LVEAGIALENASVDRLVDEFHFECLKCLRQSRLNCLGGQFSLSYLIEIIQWASPALKGKSTPDASLAARAARILNNSSHCGGQTIWLVRSNSDKTMV
jgi:hypothetical protein